MLEFSDKYKVGDAIASNYSGKILISYSEGIIENSFKLFVKSRYIIDSYDLTKLNRKGVKYPPKLLKINLDDILLHFDGFESFNKFSSKFSWLNFLKDKFTDTQFSLTGSFNVGLQSDESDLDILIFGDFWKISNYLRQNFRQLDLKIDSLIVQKQIEKLRTAYKFDEDRLLKICQDKLAGLKFETHEIMIMEANYYEELLYVYQPLTWKKISMEGFVIDNTHTGHRIPNYKIKKRSQEINLILLRDFYQKPKRCLFWPGDKLKFKGIEVSKHPLIVIATDIFF